MTERIKLLEEEAQGYWGPGVFLTVDDPREPWSLTQWAAYYGGLDPIKRGDLVAIPTSRLSWLMASIKKAACLQLTRYTSCCVSTLSHVINC